MSSMVKTFGDALAALINSGVGSDGLSLPVTAALTYRPNVRVDEVTGDTVRALIVPMRGERSAESEAEDEVRIPFRIVLVYSVLAPSGENDDARIEEGNVFAEELLVWLRDRKGEVAGADLDKIDFAKGKDLEPLLYEDDLAAGRYVQRIDLEVVTDA